MTNVRIFDCRGLIVVIECGLSELDLIADGMLLHHLATAVRWRSPVLWDRDGMFGLLPPEVIENALVPGLVAPEIQWEQVVGLSDRAAKILLQSAQKFRHPTDPSDTGTGSEGDDTQP